MAFLYGFDVYVEGLDNTLSKYICMLVRPRHTDRNFEISAWENLRPTTWVRRGDGSCMHNRAP